MFATIKKLLLARKMRQMIAAAFETLYLEQVDVNNVAVTISAGSRDGDLLRAYISIVAAVRLTQPMTEVDVQNAVERLLIAEGRQGQPEFGEILDLYRELSELLWLHEYEATLRGKLAHANDEYSFEGTIYRIQRDGRQPATLEQRAKAREICGKMAEVNSRIEERELNLLKEQNGGEYRRAKEELELRKLQFDVDTAEWDEARREVEALSNMLEDKLNRILLT